MMPKRRVFTGEKLVLLRTTKTETAMHSSKKESIEENEKTYAQRLHFMRLLT